MKIYTLSLYIYIYSITPSTKLIKKKSTSAQETLKLLQAQKKQNDELLAKIAQLEANAKKPSEPEPSQTEQLLQQTLLRMNALESQLAQSKTHDKEKEDPVGKASGARDTKPDVESKQLPGDHDDDEESNGDDEDEEFITTPSGRTAPLISIFSCSQCSSRPCLFSVD